MAMLRPGRTAVEPHNAPIAGMRPEEAARLLVLPDALAPAPDLPVVSPGGWARSEHGRMLRFAVIFDADPAAGGDALCAARAPLPAAEPRRDAFDATIALCLRDAALAEGGVTARRAEDLTPDWVAPILADLLSTMLGAAAG